MSTTSKSLLLLFAVIICMAILTNYPIEPTVEAQPKQTSKAENPHQNTCVLVEAFVVEVGLSELYKQRISPIGQKPNAVTVENILKCLDTKDIAQVTTGLKVAVPSGHRGEAKIRETIQKERQIPIPNNRKIPGPVRYVNYEIGKTFVGTATVLSTDQILLSFDFSESTYRNFPSTDDAPPNAISREWSGTVNLHPGLPSIAGATQNEETAIFLIICADIMGR